MAAVVDRDELAAHPLEHVLGATHRRDRVVHVLQEDRLLLEALARDLDRLGDRLVAEAVRAGALTRCLGEQAVAARLRVELRRTDRQRVLHRLVLVAGDDAEHVVLRVELRVVRGLRGADALRGNRADAWDLALVLVVVGQDVRDHRPRGLVVRGADGGVVHARGRIVGELAQRDRVPQALDACAARAGRVDHVEHRLLHGRAAQLVRQVAFLGGRRNHVRRPADLLVRDRLPAVEHLERGVAEAVGLVVVGDPLEHVVHAGVLRLGGARGLLRPRPVRADVGVEHHLARVLRVQRRVIGTELGSVGDAVVVDGLQAHGLADKIHVAGGVLRRHRLDVGAVGAVARIVQRVERQRRGERRVALDGVRAPQPARLHGDEVVVVVQVHRREAGVAVRPEHERIVAGATGVAEDRGLRLAGLRRDLGHRDRRGRAVRVVVVERGVDDRALEALLLGDRAGLEIEQRLTGLPLDRLHRRGRSRCHHRSGSCHCRHTYDLTFDLHHSPIHNAPALPASSQVGRRRLVVPFISHGCNSRVRSDITLVGPNRR